VKIYVAAVEALRQKEKDMMKLNLLPKLVEKLDWVLVISFCKIFIPSYTFDALICQNWLSSPLHPNRVALGIALIVLLIWDTSFKGRTFMQAARYRLTLV
jgi:hypothetical protein